ncbi:hypothetical protein ACG33_03075 [Steroidobacter denitrificans]|uniref:Alpha 1,4-glycosyltransferase domain-containing protein n=2 Tax=Steroidobacter denitrificans TaxID=465721 RepID=A0A127F6T4_STEDE|nr:hypothetical protein ACG33_03075 [Steroidobacter denitrificans]
MAAQTTPREKLPAVHMFWHGSWLSRLERLCMNSFMANGHTLLLHTYEPPKNVPPGVTLVDAAETLAQKYLFRDKRHNSVAAFADWFRFRLLYRQGGIWADTDVVCLKPLNYGRAELFAWETLTTINVAVLGLPAGHELAAWMLECWDHPNRWLSYDSGRMKRRKLLRRLRPGDTRPHIRWGEFGPRGFTHAVRHLGYENLALPFWHFYPVHYQNWHTIFDDSLRDNPMLTQASSALHLWNEMTRRARGFDKNAPFPGDSLFERLCARYLRSDDSGTNSSR